MRTKVSPVERSCQQRLKVNLQAGCIFTATGARVVPGSQRLGWLRGPAINTIPAAQSTMLQAGSYPDGAKARAPFASAFPEVVAVMRGSPWGQVHSLKMSCAIQTQIKSLRVINDAPARSLPLSVFAPTGRAESLRARRLFRHGLATLF
jgi:hypothetical protein